MSTMTSPSKSISGSIPTRTASPVPRRSCCTARSQPTGRISAIASWSGPTTTTMRSGETLSAASIT